MSVASAEAVASAGPTPIRHVIEIMLENHTFDDLFGHFPGADGIPAGTLLPDPTAPGKRIPPLVAPPQEGEVQAGMDNSRASELFAMHFEPAAAGLPAHFAMDRFTLVPGSAICSITTFAPSVDPDLQYLARHFELADENFQPVVGPTRPNVLAALTGSASGTPGEGVVTSGGRWYSIFDQLAGAGLTSRIYYGVPLSIFPGTVWPELLPAGASLATTTRFLSDLADGTLPNFSFVRPGVGYSEEPPEDVGEGDLWLGQLLAAIARSPEWGSTAVFVTYDEGGGFYDHVSPPRVEAYGYGTRTPMVIVSPYARRGVLAPMTTNLSVLAFLEHVFGLPPIDRLVAGQDDLAGAFDLDARPLAAPRLPVAPPLSLQAYGAPNRLSDLPALAPRRSASFLLEANTPGLALDSSLSGVVTLRVTGPTGVTDPLPSSVALVRGVAHVPIAPAAAGYYRITATGPAGSLGEITLDIGVSPDTP